jgi:hypothetical protein
MRMTPDSPEHLKRLTYTAQEVAMIQELVKKHGYEDFDKGTASKHEAGHVTVLSALGGRFTSCNISTSKEGCWGGYTEMFVDGIHGSDFSAFLEPYRAFWMGVVSGSGIQAEMLLHSWHPTSSVDELVVVNRAASSIALVTGITKDRVTQDINNVATTILKNNVTFLRTVSGHLANHRRLLRQDWQCFCDHLKPSADRDFLTPEYLKGIKP